VKFEHRGKVLKHLRRLQRQAKGKDATHDETPDELDTPDEQEQPRYYDVEPDDDEDEGEERYPVFDAGDAEGCVGWIVQPFGYKVKSIHWDHRLRFQGVTLAFREYDDEEQNFRVEIGSHCLRHFGGIEGAWAWVKTNLGGMGGVVDFHRLSRVDPYVDIVGVPLTEFQRRFRDDCWIGRARDDGMFRQNGIERQEELGTVFYRKAMRDSGVTLGKSPLMLRIYDKLLELELPKNAYKRDTYFSGFETEPEHVTRIEFEIRRKVIREMLGRKQRIDTVEDYLRLKPNVWAYLVQEWFRMTADVVDKEHRNHDRSIMWDVWELVQDALGRGHEPVVRDRRVGVPDLRTGLRQGMMRGLGELVNAGFRGRSWEQVLKAIWKHRELLGDCGEAVDRFILKRTAEGGHDVEFVKQP
jgi:hypothetical protein